MSANPYFQQVELEQICAQSFELATGRKVLPAKHMHIHAASPRLLIRVGLLGPAFGGQCILDFPLLTALNLCALQLCGRSFSTISREAGPERERLIRQLLGLPYAGGEQRYYCHDAWVKRIEVNLGPFYAHETMRVMVVERQGQAVGVRIQIGPEKEQTLALDNQQQAVFTLEDRRFLIKVLDLHQIELELDESGLTLGPLPPTPQDYHLLIELEGKTHLVRSGSSLVKSSLLEIANQVAPALIPEHLIGDISTPRIIPSRASHLPLPHLTRYQVDLLLMGAGPLRVSLELGGLTGLSRQQLDLLKSLFDFTFYHPELKKIFGS